MKANKLKQVASKMKPNEKANAKKIISKGEDKAKQLDLFNK